MQPTDPRITVSPSLAVYRRIALTFVALTVVVVAAVAYVVFLRAEVVVLSSQDEVKAEFEVELAESAGPGQIPGAIVDAEETVSKTFPSTSVVRVRLPSKGEVRITSSLSRAQTLVAKTRIQTEDGALYRLSKTVVVPAGGSVTVETYADDPEKPVPSGVATFTIPGLNPDTRAFFTVTSVGPLGGEEKDVRMVTASDMQQAEDRIKAELTASLTEKVREAARTAGLSMEGELLSFAIVRRSSDVEVGSDADQFTVTATVRAVAAYYDPSRVMEAVRAKMREGLSYDKVLRSVENGTVHVEVMKLDAAKGTATLAVRASGTAILSPDAPSLAKDKLLGVSADAAKEYLEGVDGVASASVRVRPWFARRLPNVPDHVTIEVR